MQKKLIALAIAGLASTAAFADSNVTLYGVLDVGVGRSSESFNFDPYHPVGVNPGDVKSPSGATGMFNGGLSASRWGIKGSEDINNDLKGIFVLESGINVQSGNLSNAALGMANNFSNGSNMSADSSMSGQLFGRQAFVGFESKDWGKITAGRNLSLGFDSVIIYDPMEGSQVFSPVGFSGTYMGGGYTDDARLDSSLKYTNTIGVWNYGALYKFGGVSGSAQAQSGYQFSGGYDDGALGIQATYMKHRDALTVNNPAIVPGFNTLGTIAVTAADTSTWVLAGHYTFENKLKFSLGYEHESFSNPSNPSEDSQLTSLFGYPISNGAGLTGPGGVNTNAFQNDKVLKVWWTGVKYPFTPALSGTIAYYYVKQNDYTVGGCPAVATGACDGTSKFTSLLLDYRLSKRTDLYGGLMRNNLDGGLAVGYPSTSSNFYGAGMRHSF